MNENDKINDIFYEINDMNDINDNKNNDNINNEKIENDMSNDNINNDLSNGDVNLENNKEKKIKMKRKKKIIKKKKKVKKINIINDNSLNNNILAQSNNLDVKEKSENIKDDNLNLENPTTNDIISQNNNGIISPLMNNSSSHIELSPKKENINIQSNDNIEIICTDVNEKNEEILSPSPPTKLQVEEILENKTKPKKAKKKLIKKRKKKNENLSKSVDDLSKKIKKDSSISMANLKEKKIQRSNSFDIINNNISELETTQKINSMKFDIGISCLLEVSKEIFAAGNLIGDIKIIERNTFKEIQTIKEHNGTINSLFKLQDGAILSTSADKLMKKIRIIKYNLDYQVEFVFKGYNNYIFKGIELSNNKIISCSWDDKLYLWEGKNNKYINTLKFNENQRVEDILEITKNKFCSVSESELKIWDSNNMSQLHSIKLQRGIIPPSSLCKINDEVLISIFYNAIHLIDLVNFRLINSISMDQSSLSCITKLNDGSILIAEDINTDKYCVFYLKQYVLEGDEFQYISYKKDKFYKCNKNNDKEIRALIQFSDGVIAQGIAGEYNGKDSGDIFFYE